MSLDTHSTTAAGGPARDGQDFARLRHARDRHVGFAVGRHLQPAPMLFTRDGHNVFLGDTYRGHTAFLICAGPSLKSHDLSKLNRRGIVTMAVNNAATVHRPQLWCSVDDPGNFCDAIWRDAGIFKFVPLCHMEKTFMVRDQRDDLVPSTERVGDMPAVFGYRRNEAFNAEQWLYEDTFNWGNHGKRTDAHGNKGSRSVMYVALRLLFYLGMRRVFLLGCDFRMQYGQNNYAFEQERSRSSVQGNNSSYRILNSRLQALQPYFANEGFEILNCTPDSGLSVFPYVDFDAAIDDATRVIPAKILTSQMYDRKQREKDSQRASATTIVKEQKPTSATSIDDIMSDLTLLLVVDEKHAEQLSLTWQTWMRYRPELRNIPIVIAHDSRFEPRGSVLQPLFDHSRVRFVRWSLDEADTQRERMLTAFVKVAASEVKTKWYLKLDCDVVATPSELWIDPHWFDADSDGQFPAFVSSPWGYTKPADAIAKLDDWGDSIAELKGFPRLDIPYKDDAKRVRHPRIASWCFFGNTEWTRTVARYADQRLPVPSHDTFLFYCAARRNDRFVTARMSNYGWETISGSRRLRRRCQELLNNDPNHGHQNKKLSDSAVQPHNECGLIYLLSGSKHAARLLVSLYSLRQHFDGPVTVITTDDAAEKVCREIVADERLRATQVRISNMSVNHRINGRKKPAYLLKTRLHQFTPFEHTLYLDCDTLVTGDISELFALPSVEHVIATQFCDWISKGRTISKRIRSWEDTHPDLVQPALEFGPAINTGAFAFTKSTRLFDRWAEVAEAGAKHFIPDELAMQLLLPHYPHVVLDGRFNCSSRYGNPSDPETRIVHYHGDKHLARNGSPRNGNLWLDIYQAVYSMNIGNIRSWTPAGDRRLKRYHRRYFSQPTHE